MCVAKVLSHQAGLFWLVSSCSIGGFHFILAVMTKSNISFINARTGNNQYGQLLVSQILNFANVLFTVIVLFH